MSLISCIPGINYGIRTQKPSDYSYSPSLRERYAFFPKEDMDRIKKMGSVFLKAFTLGCAAYVCAYLSKNLTSLAGRCTKWTSPIYLGGCVARSSIMGVMILQAGWNAQKKWGWFDFAPSEVSGLQSLMKLMDSLPLTQEEMQNLSNLLEAAPQSHFFEKWLQLLNGFYHGLVINRKQYSSTSEFFNETLLQGRASKISWISFHTTHLQSLRDIFKNRQELDRMAAIIDKAEAPPEATSIPTISWADFVKIHALHKLLENLHLFGQPSFVELSKSIPFLSILKKFQNPHKLIAAYKPDKSSTLTTKEEQLVTLIIKLAGRVPLNNMDRQLLASLMDETESLPAILKNISPILSQLNYNQITAVNDRWLTIENDFAIWPLTLSFETLTAFLNKIPLIHDLANKLDAPSKESPTSFTEDEVSLLVDIANLPAEFWQLVIMPVATTQMLSLLKSLDKIHTRIVNSKVKIQNKLLVRDLGEIKDALPALENALKQYKLLLAKVKNHEMIPTEEKLSLTNLGLLKKAWEKTRYSKSELQELHKLNVSNSLLNFISDLHRTFDWDFRAYQDGDILFYDDDLYRNYLGKIRNHIDESGACDEPLPTCRNPLGFCGPQYKHVGLFFRGHPSISGTENTSWKVSVVDRYRLKYLEPRHRFYLRPLRLNMDALLPGELPDALRNEFKIEFLKKMKETAMSPENRELLFRCPLNDFIKAMSPDSHIPFFVLPFLLLKDFYQYKYRFEHPSEVLNFKESKIKDRKEMMCSAFVALVIIESINHINCLMAQKDITTFIKIPFNIHTDLNFLDPDRLWSALKRAGILSNDKIEHFGDIVAL